MFREMRRKNQLLAEDVTEKVMRDGMTGILAVLGDDGYPYTVPLNYIYQDKTIYFHCAKAGHKLDALRKNHKVSFCVIDKETIVPEKLTTHFRSVVAFGKAAEVTSEEEKFAAMRLLAQKYAPDFMEAGEKETRSTQNALCVVKIQVQHITGKEAMELVKQRP